MPKTGALYVGGPAVDTRANYAYNRKCDGDRSYELHSTKHRPVADSSGFATGIQRVENSLRAFYDGGGARLRRL